MTRRVLILTSNFPRWAGDSTTPFVLHLARDLGAHGWEAEVLAPHAPGAERDEVLDGVRTMRFRYLVPERAQTVCYGGGALVNLRTRPRERLKLPAVVGAEWLAAARAVRSGRYDLVNAHWLLPQGAVAGLLPGRLPVVTTIHGGDIFGLRGRGMRSCKRWAARRADLITVNSSATERAVRDLVGPDAPVEVVPMGAGIGPVEPRSVAAIRARYGNGAGPLVVFVGRLVGEKGVGDLLAATRALRRRRPDLRVVIVGEGQERQTFEAGTADLGDTVQFAGWVDPEEVGAYLAAADVFVAPSRRGVDGWIEGQGLTVIESMLAGTPVVATRSGGITDSISDGATGVLVDEGRPDQLAEAVEALISDPERARNLAAAARDDARTRFSREASARRFATLFDGLTRSAGDVHS